MLHRRKGGRVQMKDAGERKHLDTKSYCLWARKGCWHLRGGLKAVLAAIAVVLGFGLLPLGGAGNAATYLHHVGLSKRMLALPSQLSGGEQQRVAIARALAVRPAAILFDEPTSSLDPELRGEVLATIKQLAGEGMTMVVVTHELTFAADVSDWVVFMDEGRVMEEGPVEQVLLSSVSDRTRQFINSR
jgi:ABC-type histidine transport system ATPase subunit